MLQQDTSDQGVDYHLMTNGLVIFRDEIYVSNDSELKKLILRKLYVKAYFGHLRYLKTLKVVKKF